MVLNEERINLTGNNMKTEAGGGGNGGNKYNGPPRGNGRNWGDDDGDAPDDHNLKYSAFAPIWLLNLLNVDDLEK